MKDPIGDDVVKPAPVQMSLIKTVAESVSRRRKAKTGAIHKKIRGDHVLSGVADGITVIARLDGKRSPGWDCCQVLQAGPLATIAEWAVDHVTGPDLKWYLGDNDEAIVGYGLEETARILTEICPDGYAVRFRLDRDGTSGALSVVESWEVDDASDDDDPDTVYDRAMSFLSSRI